ncbi:MAG: purine-nucleoside phosphorylase, partial [Rhizobiales bacterium]|nr:purine-nucleoside phosphorylase [Hyphomicrobiales bacterium]
MEQAERNAARISERISALPRVAIVLGSGLSNFVHAVERPVAFRYADLEGFPVPAVSGHSGSLVIGQIAGAPVAVLAGRGHYYE